jgi:hypothetical protein
VDEFVDRAIQRHRAEKKEEGKYVFLEELAQATQDRKVLRDQTLSVMIAGRDTTVGLVLWAGFWTLLADLYAGNITVVGVLAAVEESEGLGEAEAGGIVWSWERATKLSAIEGLPVPQVGDQRR